ncbi:MAG: hypothetical protein QGH45_01890 [Myxococcota bacterium]|jgi:hypothetical protein|nr:hypothetical protein [Myxococcota bacterium]
MTYDDSGWNSLAPGEKRLIVWGVTIGVIALCVLLILEVAVAGWPPGSLVRNWIFEW